MADWTFATWRNGLARPLAHLATIPPEVREKLEDVWPRVRALLAATGANTLQLTSFFESRFPYEFNQLAHAAVGVEQHRLVDNYMAANLPADASLLTELGNSLSKRRGRGPAVAACDGGGEPRHQFPGLYQRHRL